MAEADIDEKAMPLLDHLIELRSRLLNSLIAILVLFFVCYYFAPEIYDFLVAPLADVLEEMGGQRRLIFTALSADKVDKADKADKADEAKAGAEAKSQADKAEAPKPAKKASG